MKLLEYYLCCRATLNRMKGGTRGCSFLLTCQTVANSLGWKCLWSKIPLYQCFLMWEWVRAFGVRSCHPLRMIRLLMYSIVDFVVLHWGGCGWRPARSDFACSLSSPRIATWWPQRFVLVSAAVWLIRLILDNHWQCSLKSVTTRVSTGKRQQFLEILLAFCWREYVFANLQISPDFPAHQKKSGWLYIWVVVVVVVVVCTRRLGTRTNMFATEVE